MTSIKYNTVSCNSDTPVPLMVISAAVSYYTYNPIHQSLTLKKHCLTEVTAHVIAAHCLHSKQVENVR